MADINSSPRVQPLVQNSQIVSSVVGFSSSINNFALKLSIKLQESNFLLWNQQVDGVILSHKLHEVVVNSYIPPMLKNEQDRIVDVIFEEYESWIVHHFRVSYSTISCVKTCSWSVGQILQTLYYSQMKAIVHKLRLDLKIRKKGTRSISEYVLRIRSITLSSWWHIAKMNHQTYKMSKHYYMCNKLGWICSNKN